MPKRLINFCWFWFKWGLIACAIGAALLVPYFYHRIDMEIRRRVEQRIAKQYPGLQVKIHSAVLMKGEGIALRGMSIIDPAAEGPGAELLSFDECFLACSTDLSDLYSGRLKLTAGDHSPPDAADDPAPGRHLEHGPLVAAAETRRRRFAGDPFRERHDRDLRSHQGGWPAR